jgi:hypothetical protein
MQSIVNLTLPIPSFYSYGIKGQIDLYHREGWINAVRMRKRSEAQRSASYYFPPPSSYFLVKIEP